MVTTMSVPHTSNTVVTHTVHSVIVNELQKNDISDQADPPIVTTAV